MTDMHTENPVGPVVVAVILGGLTVWVLARSLVGCVQQCRNWGSRHVRGAVRSCPQTRVVTVTGVAPNLGPTVGGTPVTVTGTNFDNGAVVTFGGGAGVNVAWNDAQTLDANLPAHPAGPVDVIVTNPDGSSGTGVGLYTYMAPVVLQIAPIHGPIGGGTHVTITGQHFVNGCAVHFGAFQAQNVFVNAPHTITADTQAGVAGVADVVVTNPDGESGTLADGYTYDGPPVITGVVPYRGGTSGGTAVTIQGTGFQNGAVVTVGGQAAVVVNAQPHAISIATPAHARGRTDVVVTNPDAQAATLPDGFEYCRPQVLAINLGVGPFAGNIAATVTGRYFGAAVDVSVGVNPATNVVRIDEQTAAIIVPARAVGHALNVPVRVENTHDHEYGTAQIFTYQPLAVANTNPAFGPHGGATQVVVTGTGFDAGITVTVGGAAAVVAFQSSTQITVTTPALASAATVDVDMVFTNGDGQSVTLADGFRYNAPVLIAAVSPAAGPAAGANQIIVFGAEFAHPAVVRFGGRQAPLVHVLSANQLLVTVPAPAQAPVANALVNVQVQVNGVTSTLVNGYTYVVPPRLNVVLYPAGEDFVSILAHGNNQPDTRLALHRLHNDGELDDVGILAANHVLNRAYHRHIGGGNGGLLFVRLQNAPERVHQVIDVTMTRGGLTGNNYAVNLIGPVAAYGFWHAEGSWEAPDRQAHNVAMAQNFANAGDIANGIQAAFRIIAIDPPVAPVAGLWTVTIHGQNIPNGVTVTFGANAAINVVGNGAFITATVPAGVGAGAVHLRVADANGVSSEIQNAFTYQAFALISLARQIGSDAGGDPLVLVGTGFEDNATVTIGGTPAINVQNHSPTVITCQTPAHAQGAANVVVTNPSTGQTVLIPFTYL